MRLALAALAPVATPAVAPRPTGAAHILEEQPAEVRARLEREGVAVLPVAVEDDFVRALVRFQQPRRRVLRLLAQTARHREFRPELKRIDSHGWDNASALDTHHMKIMFKKISYRLRTNFDFEGGRIWWELDPGFDNDLAAVEGFWELYEIGPRNTLGRFGSRVRVGPGLPRWLEQLATRKQVPQTLEHVRQWVASDGRYRP